MRSRCVHSLLVVTLLLSGTSAPFAHVHPHGHDHGASTPASAAAAERAAPRHWYGVHWHPGERSGPETPGAAADERVSVALAVAVEAPSTRVDPPPALAAAPRPGTVAAPTSRPVRVAACADPDPPPRSRRSARAPPASH